MTNAELIQTIRTEIERLKEEAYNSILPDEPKYRTHYKVGKKELCEELLSFLSTLEEEFNISPWKKVHTYTEEIHEGDVEKMLSDLSVGEGEKWNKIALPDRVVDALEEPEVVNDLTDDSTKAVRLPDGRYVTEKLAKEIEEPVCEELDSEIESFWRENGPMSHAEYDRMAKCARHFAQWGVEHSGCSEIPKDLEEAAEISFDEAKSLTEDYRDFLAKGLTENKPRPIGPHWFCEYAKNRFIAGAKWQAEQDQETIELAEDHAYLAGAVNEREKMMKEAIHYVVQDDLDSHGASYNIPFIRLGTIALKPKGIGVGDKVCIIIVKED